MKHEVNNKYDTFAISIMNDKLLDMFQIQILK